MLTICIIYSAVIVVLFIMYNRQRDISYALSEAINSAPSEFSEPAEAEDVVNYIYQEYSYIYMNSPSFIHRIINWVLLKYSIYRYAKQLKKMGIKFRYDTTDGGPKFIFEITDESHREQIMQALSQIDIDGLDVEITEEHE